MTFDRSFRKTATGAGLLYLLTFVSIPTVALYAAVRDLHLYQRRRA